MANNANQFDDYFAHLKGIRLSGRIYKRLVTSPVLFALARKYGERIVEVGSGTGSGVLGAYPGRVRGVEINPHAVKYCQQQGLGVQLIPESGIFPAADADFDACILDNVLEHITDPRHTLDECYRITAPHGGLVIAVPGRRGFESDPDHRKFYESGQLQSLDNRWELVKLFSLPLLFQSRFLSQRVKQYCLIASYRKVRSQE